MPIIDETLFDQVGLSALTAEEKTRMLDYVNQTLFINVGLHLADVLEPAKLEAFSKLVDSGQDPSDWLEANVPDYDGVINAELDLIKAKLRENAESILNAE